MFGKYPAYYIINEHVPLLNADLNVPVSSQAESGEMHVGGSGDGSWNGPFTKVHFTTRKSIPEDQGSQF